MLLVRHGRTAWNVQRRFLGLTDVPLDEVGRAQAQRVGAALRGRVHRVYSSWLSRAWQTAQALGAPARLHGVHEIDRGHLEGLDMDQVRERYPSFAEAWSEDPARAEVPGGEPLEQCQRRALDALARVCEAHGDQEIVAIVTHQLLIALAVCGVLGQPVQSYPEHRLANAAVTALCWTGAGWEILVEGWSPPLREDGGVGEAR